MANISSGLVGTCRDLFEDPSSLWLGRMQTPFALLCRGKRPTLDVPFIHRSEPKQVIVEQHQPE
jgi:hypothetical protein